MRGKILQRLYELKKQKKEIEIRMDELNRVLEIKPRPGFEPGKRKETKRPKFVSKPKQKKEVRHYIKKEVRHYKKGSKKTRRGSPSKYTPEVVAWLKKYAPGHKWEQIVQQLYVVWQIKTIKQNLKTIFRNYGILGPGGFRSKKKVKTDYTKLKDLSKQEKEVLEEKRHLKEKGIIPDDDDVPEGWEGDEIE